MRINTTCRPVPCAAGAARKLCAMHPHTPACTNACFLLQVRGYLTPDPDEPVSAHATQEAELTAQAAAIADLTQRKQDLLYELNSYQNAKDAEVQVGAKGGEGEGGFCTRGQAGEGRVWWGAQPGSQKSAINLGCGKCTLGPIIAQIRSAGSDPRCRHIERFTTGLHCSFKK